MQEMLQQCFSGFHSPLPKIIDVISAQQGVLQVTCEFSVRNVMTREEHNIKTSYNMCIRVPLLCLDNPIHWKDAGLFSFNRLAFVGEAAKFHFPSYSQCKLRAS